MAPRSEFSSIILDAPKIQGTARGKNSRGGAGANTATASCGRNSRAEAGAALQFLQGHLCPREKLAKHKRTAVQIFKRTASGAENLANGNPDLGRASRPLSPSGQRSEQKAKRNRGYKGEAAKRKRHERRPPKLPNTLFTKFPHIENVSHLYRGLRCGKIQLTNPRRWNRGFGGAVCGPAPHPKRPVPLTSGPAREHENSGGIPL